MQTRAQLAHTLALLPGAWVVGLQGGVPPLVRLGPGAPDASSSHLSHGVPLQPAVPLTALSPNGSAAVVRDVVYPAPNAQGIKHVAGVNPFPTGEEVTKDFKLVGRDRAGLPNCSHGPTDLSRALRSQWPQ